jgi:large subunit ribosomal protein L35
MPKMKTHRGAAKRFKFTGSGKIKRSKAYKSHILTKKTTKRKRALDTPTLIAEVDQKKVARMLPYVSK